MKYMSVITNFGCHYKCPYCIVKENNLHIPKTTLAGLDNLREALKQTDVTSFQYLVAVTRSMNMISTLSGIVSFSVSRKVTG